MKKANFEYSKAYFQTGEISESIFVKIKRFTRKKVDSLCQWIKR